MLLVVRAELVPVLVEWYLRVRQTTVISMLLEVRAKLVPEPVEWQLCV